MTKMIPWNKGLTKDTDSRIADYSAKLSGKKKNYTVWNKGLTKDDPRVMAYASKLPGRIVSDDTRRKISLARTKKTWYDICQECGRPKGHSPRKRCCFCAAKYRARNYPNSMLGRKLTKDHKDALHKWSRRKMTKPEIAIQSIVDFMFNPFNIFAYAGNGSNWININNNRTRNPDFTDSFQKKVIEVFGRYWHRNDDPEKVIREYKSVGWDCLIIWDDEINSGTRDKIMEFACPYEYDAELKEPFI